MVVGGIEGARVLKAQERQLNGDAGSMIHDIDDEWKTNSVSFRFEVVDPRDHAHAPRLQSMSGTSPRVTFPPPRTPRRGTPPHPSGVFAGVPPCRVGGRVVLSSNIDAAPSYSIWNGGRGGSNMYDPELGPPW